MIPSEKFDLKQQKTKSKLCKLVSTELLIIIGLLVGRLYYLQVGEEWRRGWALGRMWATQHFSIGKLLKWQCLLTNMEVLINKNLQSMNFLYIPKKIIRLLQQQVNSLSVAYWTTLSEFNPKKMNDSKHVKHRYEDKKYPKKIVNNLHIGSDFLTCFSLTCLWIKSHFEDSSKSYCQYTQYFQYFYSHSHKSVKCTS